MSDLSAHTIIQCLSVIAQHHGLPGDPVRLIEDYGHATNEPDAELLLRMAADLGLSAKADTLSWKDLLTSQDGFPILIRLDNGKGAIVVDAQAAGAGKVAILDPIERQAKIRWLDRRLLCRRWHGDVVFLQPLPAPTAHDKLVAAIQLQQEGKLEQAKQLFHEVLSREPHHPAALYSLAVIALNGGKPQDALELTSIGIRDSTQFSPLWYAHGAALHALGRKEEALLSYDEALRIKPDYIEALNSSGVLLRELLRHRDAIERFNRALGIDPTSTSALANTAILLTEFKASDQAIAMFARLLALNPNYDYGLGLLVYERLHICDWNDFERSSQAIIEGIRAGRRICKTLAFMAISDSAEDHLKAAKIFAASYCPRKPISLWQGEHYRHAKIRIAYVSPDFREHPVGHLMAGIFEHHDKSRFETIAISLGIDDHSRLRERMLKAFDHFVDARLMGSQQIAEKMREMEVDIAIDLAGYTSDSRVDIFAYRPAPVQVSYLGYPGTLGTDYIDYIIADRLIIPEEHRAFFSEQIVYLPDTYLPTDASIFIAEQTPTRTDCGLPEVGFVFCSFSHDYKISPLVFSVWMRLLDQIPGSVLWLMSRGEVAQRNLRHEAQQRGIDPSRLVFASRVPRVEDHLARYRQADLFLDTHPYNAHTTAADALMTGLPVITYMGNAFPARVAGSLLHAIGLPELITHSLKDYETLALSLATHPERLADVKRRLLANRTTHPLFDTLSFCCNLETLYRGMLRTAEGIPVTTTATEKTRGTIKVDGKKLLVQAFEHHVSGDVRSAESMYKEVLQADPNDLFARILTNLIKMQAVILRSTKQAGLSNLKHCGFNPATVFDVGAQVGTPPLYEVFPEAHHVMLEPVKEHEPILKGICQSLKSAECMMVAVTSRSGPVSLSVTDSLQFASIDSQLGSVSNNRVIDAVSLNDLCSARGFSGPFLIKIDVDGVEIEVLKGASSLISSENIFVIEASLLDEFPRFSKIIDFFRPYGFVLYDIVDHLYRPVDNALWQVDVIMVHESHPLREKRHFI